jgi:REP element-mobilizing transposase RayT
LGVQPLYRAEHLTPSYKLRYGWTGWPSAGTSFPAELESVARELADAWEGDGLRLLQLRFSAREAQLTFSVKPHVSPVVFTARVKGRLQHGCRQRGVDVRFSRKVAMRSIGENRRENVEAYIEGQVGKEPLADPRFADLLRQFTVVRDEVDLSRPTETRSGRYWYNLHLVLVTEARYRIGDPARLGRIRDTCFRIAEKKGHAISRLSVMPDHFHVALRGNIEHAPEDIALALMNNLAYALGQIRWWRRGYYAGTFSEYDMGAVRRASRAGGECDA